MPMMIRRKTVSCPNCGHKGTAKAKGAFGAEMAWLIVTVLAFVFVWPIGLLCLVGLLWMMFKPAQLVCSRCSYAHVYEVTKTTPASGAATRFLRGGD